jgi:formylglycine-generating enzyme required for sulfatase activity
MIMRLCLFIASAVFVLLAWMTSAHAQIDATTQARIDAYVRQSNEMAAAYAARPQLPPYAEERARSQRLTAAQRAQAQTLFNSAFEVWRAGDLNAAEIGFRQGLEIDPANGAANFYMGDILRRRGASQDAAAFMARTAALAPQSAEGLRAQAALRELPAPLDPELAAPPVIFAPPGEQVFFRECADCPEMAVVPAGRYTMGSPESEAGHRTFEGPLRRINIARALAVGRFEITRGQYAAFVQATQRPASGGCVVLDARGQFVDTASASWRNPGFVQDDDHPVVCVSWDDARAYVDWLNTQTAGGYRLLSESEWEYVARAGANSTYPWGESIDVACAHSNVADSTLRERYGRWDNALACSDGASFTAAIGSYRANAFGLHDLSGNVIELVADCKADTLSLKPLDGSPYEVNGCTEREARGGGWNSTRARLRTSERSIVLGSSRYSSGGFRVARTLY